MSDLITPDTVPSSPSAPQPAARSKPTQRSKALQLIAVALGFIAMVMIALAGVPSAGQTPMPRVASLPPRTMFDLSRSGELSQVFAELCAPVDAAGQRPAYPTTDELGARLEQMPGWESAALFALDATPGELFAAGMTDPELAATLASAPTPESVPSLRHWTLALVDAHGQIVGTALFEVPAPEIEHLASGESGPSSPTLDRRFPVWPRVQVFKRAGGGAQSDG